MTRAEFRGRVEGPRPPAAWLMSLVAAATLWLTEQLPPWLVALQVLAFAFSFATRRRPPAFRSDPIWLNVLMAGVTTVTIRSALAGNPATVSLAWFTALAQGLQLIDARPRKSEFVLVALALFQVVLASNLTDSVFFPPLVLVFLVAVTWTLLVHTLAHEAAEAGDPGAAERAIAPDLRRLTFVATSACVLLAIVLFVALPRLKTSALSGSLRTGMGLSGFSDTVGKWYNDIVTEMASRTIVNGKTSTTFDGDGCITRASHRFNMVTDSGSARVIGRKFEEFLAEESRHRFGTALAAGNAFRDLELAALSGDGVKW